MGKGTIVLNNGKSKAKNGLYVDGMKHNILSVNQMCDQGYDLTFHSKFCEIRKAEYGRVVANATRTSSNGYILDGAKEDCCMGKLNERWLWHRRMGHISFDNIVELNKTQAVRDMTKVLEPYDTICKPWQHGK